MEDFTGSVQTEMPKYQSHKKVWALKIKEIVLSGDGQAVIVPGEEPYASFTVDKDYMDKHKPAVGGYYVVYKDGYRSFSPAEAFEDGHTRI